MCNIDSLFFWLDAIILRLNVARQMLNDVTTQLNEWMENSFNILNGLNDVLHQVATC